MKYCTYCGKQLADGKVCSCEGAKSAASSKLSKAPADKKKLIIPAAAILAVLIILVILISGGKNTLHLEDYIIIEGVSGAEGTGVLEYSLDETALTDAMFGDLYEEDLSEDNWEAVLAENLERQLQVENALDCITLTAEPETGLSAGDKVTVTATFENTEKYKFDFKFKSESKTYTVDSIVPENTINTSFTPAPSDSTQDSKKPAQLMPVNPFAEGNISVTFVGINGSGNAVIEVLSTEDVIGCFNYWSPDTNSLLNSGNLSNGDIITVKADYWEADLYALGYAVPQISEKTYTVTGLSEYYNLSNGVPKEILSEFCEYALGMAKEYDAETNPDIAAEYRIARAYTMVSNDPNWPHFSNVYGYSVVNGIAVIVPSAVIENQWYLFVGPNFIVDSEGNIEYDEASILPWRPVQNSIEDTEGWARGLFFDMTITEMPLSHTHIG